MQIEKVDVKDSEALLDIYSYYVLNTAISFEYEVPSLKEFEERISSISLKYPYLKLVKDGRIIGYAYASAFKDRKAYEKSVELSIYIAKDEHRKGYGRLLYEALEKELKEKKFVKMFACVAISEKEDGYLNNDSLHFHRSLGFDMVGVFHKAGYKFDRYYDMAYLEKEII